jgi:transcriptional regulator with XRE-family HTH domain
MERELTLPDKHRQDALSNHVNPRYSAVMTARALAAVLGENCRQIRRDANLTQDDLAKAARRFGLRWTASKVRDFEAGRSAPTFATVLALTAALEDATDQRPRLADLVRFDGVVTVTEDFKPAGELLTSFCAGGRWDRLSELWEDHRYIGTFRPVLDWSGLTDQRVAASLGLNTEQLCDAAVQLWGTAFSAERDRRAGPDANPQKRGRVTRELKAELMESLSDGNR